MIGLACEARLVGRLGAGLVALHEQHLSQPELEVGRAIARSLGRAEGGLRLGIGAQVGLQDAQLELRLGVAGLGRDRALQRRQRRGLPPHPRERHREQHQRPGGLRGQRRRAGERIERLGRPAERQERLREMQMPVRPAGLQRHDPLEGGEGRGLPPLRHLRVAQHVGGQRAIGRGGEDRAGPALGRGHAARLIVGEQRLDLGRRGAADARLRHGLHGRSREARLDLAQERGRQSRLPRRLGHLLAGGGIAEGRGCGGPGLPARGLLRAGTGGTAQPVQRLGRTAGGEQAAQMEVGGGLVRRHGQHGAVALFGLGQAAGLVQAQRLGQEPGEVGRVQGQHGIRSGGLARH
ncbi:hypothetical protein CESP606_12485 [Cereibacter sphaeroides]|nr:hypothetical protein RSP03_26660 [Cereibacter sphaeroides]